MEYRLALIGFGNVGQGLAQIIRDRGEDLARRYGAELRIVAVADLIKGSASDPDGLDAANLLERIANGGKLDGGGAVGSGWDALDTIARSSANVVVELSYTDLETAEPALSHIRAALAAGKHVITTNKGPVALHCDALAALARDRDVELGVEGTVLSGTPALRLATELLAGAGVTRVQGILNGTTNYILTRMEEGITYHDAVAHAQARGYAEVDPTGDVEGHDAVAKVVILGNLLFGRRLTIADVGRRGITQLTATDVSDALRAEERWKLIGSVGVVDGELEASVEPVRLPMTHPLASVGGAANAITYTTELLGDVTLVGPGAGRLETGYALISDLLAIHRKRAVRG